MNTAKETLKGFGWISGTQYISTAIRFLGGIYLARRIDPVFFGQQGLAVSIATLMWAFVTLGEHSALIKQQKNVNSYIQSLLFIRISIVAVLTAVFMVLWSQGWLPASSEVRQYVFLIFLSQIPAQIGSIYISYITKKMFFRRLAFLNIASTLSAIALACLLAYLGFTIWALLWLFMAEQIVKAVLTVFLTPKRFLPRFNKNHALEFFHFSKYATFAALVDRFRAKIDSISIGTLAGNAQLGFYQRAIGLGGILQQTTIGGLSTVTQPYFSSIQGDKERFGKHFELVGSVLIRTSCIMFVCLAFVLPNIVLWVYGEKWLPTVPIFRLLLPFAVLQSFRAVLRNTHLVAGSVKFLTVSQIVELASLLIFLYPLIYWKGVLGAAVAVNIGAITGVGVMLYYLRKFADFSVWKIFGNPLIAVVSSVLLIVWGAFICHKNVADINIGITIVLFTSLFSAALMILEYTFIKQIFALIYKAVRPEKYK